MLDGDETLDVIITVIFIISSATMKDQVSTHKWFIFKMFLDRTVQHGSFWNKIPDGKHSARHLVATPSGERADIRALNGARG